MSFKDKIVFQKRRIDRLGRNINRIDQKSRRISILRLFIFLTGLICIIGFYWIDKRMSGISLIASLFVFGVVAWQHRRVELNLKRFTLWREFAEDKLARMTVNWQQLPGTKEIVVEDDHPFDKDVNVSGKYSLYRLLDICITKQGSRRLADWLLNVNPDLEKILQRQTVVRELKKLRQFRNGLRLDFRLVSDEQLSGDKVRQWLALTKSNKKLAMLLAVGMLLCLVNIALVLWPLAGGPAYWGYGLFIYAVFILFNRDIWFHLGDEAAFLDMEFKQSMAIFRFLENYNYMDTPELRKICAVFIEDKTKPIRQLKLFMVLAVLVGLRMNYMTGLLLNIFFPYDFLCALLINRQKQKVGSQFAKWLDIVYELDALFCLANFAEINDKGVFATFGTDQENAHMAVKELGHPFIPADKRICNDFTIQGNGCIVLITGSNMSGKSTFLRTLGINLVLAHSGAPVIASFFSTSLLRLFCCIQINDSITDGMSQFYAEVKRLKRLKDELGESGLPILYLIDEIYKGTNNRERFIGSRAIIKSLAHVNGLGLVSTHDLELAQLESVRNVHFREHIKHGKLRFDYKLYNGPCPTTNALKIMRLEGLPV